MLKGKNKARILHTNSYICRLFTFLLPLRLSVTQILNGNKIFLMDWSGNKPVGFHPPHIGFPHFFLSLFPFSPGGGNDFSSGSSTIYLAGGVRAGSWNGGWDEWCSGFLRWRGMRWIWIGSGGFGLLVLVMADVLDCGQWCWTAGAWLPANTNSNKSPPS